MDFPEALDIYKIISTVPFNCSGETPIISVFDNQKEGYALIIKKLNCDLKQCDYCCVREFLKKGNLRVIENENCLTISSYKTVL